MSKVSNEIIIAALLQHGTIKEAAAAAGTSQRTIYNRLRDQDFRNDYMEAKTGIVRAAAIALNLRMGKAIETVYEIMLSTEISPAIRLQAAQTIIGNAARFTGRLSDEEGNRITEADNW